METASNMETVGNPYRHPDRHKPVCSGRQRAGAVAGGRHGVRERRGGWMENTPVLSSTEGTEKTESNCAQEQGYIIGTQEQGATRNRAEGRDTTQGRLCADMEVPFHDFDLLGEV